MEQKTDMPQNTTQQTSLNLKYQAESQVIRNKIGTIEDVRKGLGVSQRKMAQLLMVDPSSWNRWSKTGKTPSYIYRSLQWYLALIEKQPEWHPQNSFLGGNDTRIYELERKFTERINALEFDNANLTEQLKLQTGRRTKELLLMCSLLVLALMAALLIK